MKKALLTLVCMAAMAAASTGLKAQEVTITIMPGWNWISVPLMDTLDFETALGTFTPEQGDIIKSKWSNAHYRNGQWVGQISQFYPGYGYMYKSNKTMPAMVTFHAQQPAPQVVVTTSEPTDITTTSATCGGNVASNSGDYVFVILKGICWSTNPNPTFNDNYIEAGNGLGSFTVSMTELTPGITYYVRACAVTADGTYYGEQKTFVTSQAGVWIDLGLPSGLLWATCNVGADAPEEYGDYFAWGETQPKDTYNWSTYQYCNGTYNTLTKYCNNSSYSYNGFTDNLTTLLPEDDAATANWGSDWRMPTQAEFQELLDNTTVTLTTQNGVNGHLFTASNGNSLFLPAAGYYNNSDFSSAGSYGFYWSSSLYTDYPDAAWNFSSGFNMSGYSRYYGFTVRPVRSSGQNSTPTGAINGKFTINEDGDQVYFSQGNLQYIGSAATPYWKFADNQWDVLGITTGQNSSDQNVDRDLFGWGTSGYNHGASGYQPWITDLNNFVYYAYGEYTCNLYDQSGQADWGYNPISNGGNQENLWRTLTQLEWNYIFNTRSTASDIRYAKAKVNDVSGVILLPDDWNVSYYSLSSANTIDASFNSNTITAEQWSVLEQHGAIFLPAAGHRMGTSLGGVSSGGGYWSAAYYDSENAYYMYFYDYYLSTLNTSKTERRTGCSVRLVIPLEN